MGNKPKRSKHLFKYDVSKETLCHVLDDAIVKTCIKQVPMETIKVVEDGQEVEKKERVDDGWGIKPEDRFENVKKALINEFRKQFTDISDTILGRFLATWKKKEEYRKLKLKGILILLFTGDVDYDNLPEEEIKSVVNRIKIDQKIKDRIVMLLTIEPPTIGLPTIEKISAIVNYGWLLLFLGIIFWATGLSGAISRYLFEQRGMETPPSQLIIILGLVFQTVGIASFLGAFIIVRKRNKQFQVNKVYEKPKEFKDRFLLTVPNQVMNLGLITMIFAIIGVIFFKEDMLLDLVDYANIVLHKSWAPWGINLVQVLMVMGGMTEAAAFYLGYRFPEKLKLDEKEIGSESLESGIGTLDINEIVEGVKTGMHSAIGQFSNKVDQLDTTLANNRTDGKTLTSEQIADGFVKALDQLSFTITIGKKQSDGEN